jgi:hypothetical protein
VFNRLLWLRVVSSAPTCSDAPSAAGPHLLGGWPRTGRPGFHCHKGHDFFFAIPIYIAARRSTQFPFKWVMGAPSFGAKRLEREAKRSQPSNIMVENK